MIWALVLALLLWKGGRDGVVPHVPWLLFLLWSCWLIDFCLCSCYVQLHLFQYLGCELPKDLYLENQSKMFFFNQNYFYINVQNDVTHCCLINDTLFCFYCIILVIRGELRKEHRGNICLVWSLAFIWTYSSIISGLNFGACFAFTKKERRGLYEHILWLFVVWTLVLTFLSQKKGGGWGGTTCHGYCSCFDLVSWLMYGPHLFQYFGLMICGWIFGALFSQRRKRIFFCWNSKTSLFILLHPRTTPLFQYLNKLMDQVEVVVGGLQKECLSWNTKTSLFVLSDIIPFYHILLINACPPHPLHQCSPLLLYQ